MTTKLDWTISGEKAAILLRWCLPYLLIKRDKAIKCLEVWEKRSQKNSSHFYVEKARREMAELGFES